jgi:hypothetical protein
VRTFVFGKLRELIDSAGGDNKGNEDGAGSDGGHGRLRHSFAE